MRRLLVTLVCMLLSGNALAAQEGKAKLLERAGMSRARGQQTAKVTVLEISDFQCPFCGRFARDVYPLIDSAYVRTGKVQWVFVNLPLPNHQHAWHAAEAALCAGGAGGAFWAMHEQLFANQAEWLGLADPSAVFRSYALAARASPAAYDTCVARDLTATLLLQDLLYAAALRINGTPGFVINNEQTVVGLKDFEEWQRLLDAALGKK